MSEELKPCPFCAGKPYAQENGRFGFRYWEVVCDNECDFTGPAKDTKGQAVEAWNRRDPDAAKDAEIEKLKAALTSKFCVCFMDGINDHGAHVLPSFPRSVDCDFDILEQAQAIWAAGEIEGFHAGDHIWCEFAFHPAQTGEHGQVELASYWEFVRVDKELSKSLNAAALKGDAA